VAIAAALALRAYDARAQDASGASGEADACFTAAERAQPLMKEKRFREARADLEMCARDVCPRVARTDCRDWLSQVDREQPSIVIAAREANSHGDVRDVVGVRATIDGGITVDRVDATPITLDPGKHRVRVERPGREPIEQTIDLRESEKGHVATFTWQTQWVPPHRDAPADVPMTRPVPPGVYALGILGLAAVGVGSYLEANGLSKRNTLQGCKPNCQQSAVDEALSFTRAGDITVGTGIAALLGATVLFFARPSEPAAPAPPLEVDLGPMPGGVMTGLRGSF
jgi:hypothetical protein